MISFATHAYIPDRKINYVISHDFVVALEWSTALVCAKKPGMD